MSTDLAIDVSTELDPPPEPKRRDKKWRKHPRPGAQTRRGPPRPYRRLPEETLAVRIKKLTDRMEKARKQHEDSRLILTKYSHERTYRLREALLNTPPDTLVKDESSRLLPEFEQVKPLEEASVPEPPNA
jgi:hypothetical protein